MEYIPISTNTCVPTPITTPVTHVYNIYSDCIPNDTSAGCTPLGWCGTAYEWAQLNKNLRNRYDNVTFIDDSYSKEEIHHPIKITDCPKCASNLPLRETDDKGICKCNYCGKEVYVW